MNEISWIITTSIFLAELTLRIGLSIRIIMRKQVVSVTFSWLVVILMIPFLGAIIYLLLSENRLGERRVKRAAVWTPIILQLVQGYKQRAFDNWQGLSPQCEPIHKQIDTVIGIPTMPDNKLTLIDNSRTFFRQLIADIDQAKTTCFLEFFIWHNGGEADKVGEALKKAYDRGVCCRILVDSIGSKEFLGSDKCRELHKHGICISESLPAGLFRSLFVRIDLRNHRKIISIDNRIGYTGSHNLVDPRFFKQDQGVGEWVDIMVRIEGPVLIIITMLFLFDWAMEEDTPLCELTEQEYKEKTPPLGDIPVQIAPSGPGYIENCAHDLLLTTIYAARKEIILTTPYFVPDNAILTALKSASQRGILVTIIVPEKNNSRMVHYASRALYDELLDADVKIMLFSQGLLHAKTISVDNEFCLIGSVNLDMRSFWLNFEMTMLIYNRDFTISVRDLQQHYLDLSVQLTRDDFQNRSFRERFLENITLLVSPLL
jgi:cardiolipin synthase